MREGEAGGTDVVPVLGDGEVGGLGDSMQRDQGEKREESEFGHTSLCHHSELDTKTGLGLWGLLGCGVWGSQVSEARPGAPGVVDWWGLRAASSLWPWQSACSLRAS